MMLRIILAAGVAFYLLSTAAMAGGVAWVTLWAYGVSEKPLADTVSAAILNASAATLLWLAFFGGFDMFFTVWQMMQNRQQAEQHRKEKEGWEEERKTQAQALEEQRKARALELEEQRKERAQALEEERKARTLELEERRKALEEQRQFQQAILEHLLAEREENRRERAQFLAMMARFMELTEGMVNRNGNRNGGGNGDVNGRNGSGGSGDGDDSGNGGGGDGDGGAHTAPGDAG